MEPNAEGGRSGKVSFLVTFLLAPKKRGSGSLEKGGQAEGGELLIVENFGDCLCSVTTMPMVLGCDAHITRRRLQRVKVCTILYRGFRPIAVWEAFLPRRRIWR